MKSSLCRSSPPLFRPALGKCGHALRQPRFDGKGAEISIELCFDAAICETTPRIIALPTSCKGVFQKGGLPFTQGETSLTKSVVRKKT
jgi:hypothetical protein